MAVTTVTGVVDTEARLADEKVVDMDPDIAMLDVDTNQFMTMLSKLPSRAASQVKVNWLEDQYFPSYTTLAASVSASDTTISVATDTGVYFRAHDIVQLGASGEKVEVTSISADVLTVTRSIGGVAAASSASGADVLILGNASGQGADTGTLKATKRVLGYNYTQIQRDPFGFTGTDAEIELYGADDPEREAAKKRIEHKGHLEKLCWVGARDFTSGSPSSTGYMGGITEFLSTNVFTAYGAISSLSAFDAKVQQIFQHGTQDKVIFAAPTPARALSNQLATNWVRATPDETKYGAKVSAFVNGAYGQAIPVIVKREWGIQGTSGKSLGGALFVLDMQYLKRRPMRNRDTRLLPNRQGNGQDQVVFDYLTEQSLEVKNEAAHGAFFGITG
jgi:hypothetical protein